MNGDRPPAPPVAEDLKLALLFGVLGVLAGLAIIALSPLFDAPI